MQKTIVRNGLIAVLVAFLMVLICMPQNASAIAEPELTLSGYTVSFPADYEGGTSNPVDTIFVVGYRSGTIVNLESVAGKTSYDLSECVAKEFEAIAEQEEGDNTARIHVVVYYSNGEDVDNEFDFIQIDAQATTNVAVTEDTTFEYEVEEVVDYGKDDVVAKRAAECASLAENKLVIAKGDTVSSAVQKLILAVDIRALIRNLRKEQEIVYWFNIKEKAADNGYSVSTNEYGVVLSNATKGMDKVYYGLQQANPDTFNEDQSAVIVNYNRENGVDDVIKDVNAVYGQGEEEFLELIKTFEILNTKDGVKAATFKHVGVQTADTNELGLWIALFAIAAVCGGAVALKKN